MNKIKQFFLPALLIIGAIIAALKFFVAPKKEDVPFPGSEEKKKAEADVADTKEDIAKIGDKVYSDEDIEKRFNK